MRNQTIVPYNDIWLSCINNNLISMLLQRDVSYNNILLHLGVKYYYKITDQVFNYEGEKERFLNEGFFTPKIMFSLGNLEKLFEQKPFSFNSYDRNQLHEFITSGIQEGYCLFLKVDRYFYNDGREAGKTHMFHPVFIYGYEDNAKSYHCFEDCIIPGTIDYYKLSYSSVDQSCLSFIENGDVIDGMLCRPIADLPQLEHSETPINEAIRMSEGLLEGGVDTEYNLLYQTGISGLDSYSKEYAELFNKMQEFSLYKMRILQFQQLHMRNQQLIDYLINNKLIDPQRGKQLYFQYQSLFEVWGHFKRKSFGELAKKKIKSIGNSEETIMDLARQLSNIRVMEEKAVYEFLSLSQSN